MYSLVCKSPPQQFTFWDCCNAVIKPTLSNSPISNFGESIIQVFKYMWYSAFYSMYDLIDSCFFNQFDVIKSNNINCQIIKVCKYFRLILVGTSLVNLGLLHITVTLNKSLPLSQLLAIQFFPAPFKKNLQPAIPPRLLDNIVCHLSLVATATNLYIVIGLIYRLKRNPMANR